MKHHSTLRGVHVSEAITDNEVTGEIDEKAEVPLDSDNKPYLKRNTPILFSTNRGLHLRTTSNCPVETQTLASASNRTTTSAISSNYNIVFCDLERWSKNRANTVSLEDTFTIPKPSVVPSSAASGSLASTSLRMFPQRSTSVRFNGYARFDVE